MSIVSNTKYNEKHLTNVNGLEASNINNELLLLFSYGREHTIQIALLYNRTFWVYQSHLQTE